MKKNAVLTLGIIALLTFPIIAGAAEKDNTPRIGMKAPALEGLQWIKGGPVKMERGSIYVVEFWATWCPPCRKSIPHLTKVQAEFKDKGVTIIGVSDETPDKVKPFVAEKGDEMDYVVAISPDRHVHKIYMEAFKVRGIPNAFIIDKTGTLVWQGHPMAGMDQVLAQVVAGDFDHVSFAKKQAAEQAEMKKLQTLYNDYFKATGEEPDLAKAKTIGVELAKSDNTNLLNAVAWRILTKVPEANRDLELARRMSGKAVKLTEEKNASLLDTYAKATYELAKKYVAQAVASQRKAVEISGDNEDLKKNLEQYESASID
jgi:thiol-disulfide isomerase/thioredoxin